MNMKKRIPCQAGWITAGAVGALALVPNYLFVRLVPLAIALVIALYCLIGLWEEKRPRAAKVTRMIFTILLILILVAACITGGFILRAGKGSAEEDCPYIVVLGAQVRIDGPSESLRERILAARDYLNRHPDTVAILSGGKGDDEHMSEAQCMYEELIRLGIDEGRLIKEDQAASTWANLSYSLDIIEDLTGQRPDTLGVVSSEYHLFRTGLQAKAHGLEIMGIPAKTGTFPRWLHFFLREIVGVWHYFIMGGQYK